MMVPSKSHWMIIVHTILYLNIKARLAVFLRSFATLRSRLGLAGFLPKVSMDINEPIENHQVGQNGYNDNTEVGLPGDCSEHY